jgi:excisionase family DNA binding protein
VSLPTVVWFGEEHVMEKIAVSVREASHLLSLGTTKIYELINLGQLTRIKVGRKSLITSASIFDFVENTEAR